MKLGASYNLFDGEELLESSILSIRDNVDFISVVYQTQSNHGNPANPCVIQLLSDLIYRGLIDTIFHYTPDISKHPHENELNKRNIGLNLSRENHCTHHLSIDADEFYDSQQFELAKQRIETVGYDASVCRLWTYYKNNHTVLDPMEDYFVSFIYKINPDSKFDIIQFPVLVDPTRRIKNENILIFHSPDDLVMHHFSYIRKDLKMKLQNSSAKENWDDQMMDRVIHHFDQWQPGMNALLAPATEYKTMHIDPKFKPWD